MPTSAERALDRIVSWARDEPEIGRVVLVGSRARTPPPDDLADVDVQVYAAAPERLANDLGWLSRIGDASVCVRDRYRDGGGEVRTRLVIFSDGVKVDFAFYPDG